MQLSAKGAAFVRAHEGFVPRWYLDPIGVPTIGVGMTWRSAAFRKWWGANKRGIPFAKGATMTRAEADDALRMLMADEYGAAVNSFLGKTVPQHVFDAMCSMTFNCGAGALQWKWAKAAKAGDYRMSAGLLRNTATTASGKRLAGLVRRRKEEAELLLNGSYGGAGGMPDADAMSDGILVRGERGDAVKAMQERLRDLGYYDGAIDGIFGHGTEAAVLAFQEASKLSRDGRAGPKTLAALTGAKKPDATPMPKAQPAPAASGGFWAWLFSFFRGK